MNRCILIPALLAGALQGGTMQTSTPAPVSTASPTPAERLARYTTVKLDPNESQLTAKERQMLPLLVDAARAMDPIFWIESYGDRDALLSKISEPAPRLLADINFGPWDRLDDNSPFVPGFGRKPDGANYYPSDMTKAEFETAVAAGGARADSLKSLYTVVRRDGAG